MKNTIKMLGIVAIFFSGSLFAQDSVQVQARKGYNYKNQYKIMQGETAQKNGFIDVDGNGVNDNAPDLDGDGIPNGKDADFTGSKSRKGNNSKGFIDADGDGMNDNAVDADGDGIPNGKDADYVRPLNGTGAGNGTGDCNATGTKVSKGKGRK